MSLRNAFRNGGSAGALLSLLTWSLVPSGAALAKTGLACDGRAYIGNTDWQAPAEQRKEFLSVVDTATNQVLTAIPMRSPYNPLISPDGTKVYVTNGPDSAVAVVDTRSATVTSTLKFDGHPTGLDFTPDGKLLLVTFGGETMEHTGAVRVVEVATGKISPPIPVGRTPERVTTSPTGKHAYVVNRDSVLTIIDIAQRKVSGSIPLVGNTFSVIVSPDGKKAYAALSRQNLVAAIDLVANKVEHYIQVGTVPIGLAFSPDYKSLYVTANTDGTIQHISLEKREVTMTKKVGDRPGLLRLSADGKKLYVVYSSSKHVGVIDTAEFQKGESMPVEGFKGYPGQVKLPPLPEVALTLGVGPSSLAVCGSP